MRRQINTVCQPPHDPGSGKIEIKNLLLTMRGHGVTRDQREALRNSISEAGDGRLIFVITGADQKHRRRHPLALEERLEIVTAFAKELGREYHIFAVNDILDGNAWVDYLCAEVSKQSGGAIALTAANTVLVAANPDVLERFRAQASTDTRLNLSARCLLTYSVRLQAAATGAKSPPKPLRVSTTNTTSCPAFALSLRTFCSPKRANFSVGRNFQVYIKGMEAGMQQKLNDMFTWVLQGLIVDMGCGSGKMLEHLSAVYGLSQIVGVDLSTELLRVAEALHFANHNVSVVRGNIIEPRFKAGSVSTFLYSSVMHEVRSYTN